MDWPDELVKLQTAVSTEHGTRIFKSILTDILDNDDKLRELRELKLIMQNIESRIPSELMHISQQLGTLSTDIIDAMARIAQK